MGGGPHYMKNYIKALGRTTDLKVDALVKFKACDSQALDIPALPLWTVTLTSQGRQTLHVPESTNDKMNLEVKSFKNFYFIHYFKVHVLRKN